MRTIFHTYLKFCTLAILISQSAAAYADAPEKAGAIADDVANANATEFKLTPSYYRSSDGNDAVDINLRASRGAHTVWLGEYHDKSGYLQARTGYENKLDLGNAQVVFSGQLASGGFVGGSITAEIGGENFAILGFGRTNLRDYYNLNFDPNDAITIGVGTHMFSQTEVSLFQVRDDRLDTQQRVTHFVWRYKPSSTQRVSIDSSYKSGLINGTTLIHGYALSATYDFGNYFGRIGRDQYANFSANHLTRLSLGMRF